MAQSQKPSACYASGAGSTSQQSHIRLGAGVGFSAFAIAGALIALNIVGFPEVEAVEAGAAVAEGGMVLTADSGFGLFLESIAEPGSSMAVGAVTAGAYGLVVGGAVGAYRAAINLAGRRHPFWRLSVGGRIHAAQ